ncbi:alpha/beta fold hydrolase [Streptomonospora nanhaiensis]|uniref:alpha/beta fold hydrolase n=1 Tax=Streptomonospora nanhaiensis TaxID=1323731 RepID=UPI0027E19592|nr:alpha/beta hydrolase [Streptomonospora nanhaiensis]
MSIPRFLDLPACVRPMIIQTPLGAVAALRATPASGGAEHQPALLVPGYTGSKEDFIALLETLAQAGRSVTAIDMPGQYESPGLPDPAQYTPDGLGRVIGEVALTLDDGPVHLLGHSFGGLVSRETVISGAVPLLSFTLMSSGPSAIGGPRARDAGGLAAALGTERTRARLEEVWTQHLEEPTRASGVDPEIHAFLRRRMLANHPEGLVRMAEALLAAPDRTADLARAELPMLVLYGENDDAWPPEAQAAMAATLGAERVVVPGAAHSPNVEAPETTAQALTAFWNRTEKLPGLPA